MSYDSRSEFSKFEKGERVNVYASGERYRAEVVKQDGPIVTVRSRKYGVELVSRDILEEVLSPHPKSDPRTQKAPA